MNSASAIRILGVLAMLTATVAPIDHCAIGDAAGTDACCASLPAEPGQGAPASLPDTSRDCAGHHLAPCCDGMPALELAAILSTWNPVTDAPETALPLLRPALRSSVALRPPIAIA